MTAVVVYSGGMDSFTALHEALATFGDVHAVSFNYGQRHSVELERAHAVCTLKNIPHQIVDLRNINSLIQGSSLTSDIDVPEGHYAEENMQKTVVPNRNMIMLSLAVGYAVSIDSRHVVCGAHAGDHDIYPDCRSEFFEALNSTTKIANYLPVGVHTPFIKMSKGEILSHGCRLGLTAADYLLTWTCYNGREQACGKCGACVERLESFAQMGWTDPLQYEDREYWKGVVANG
jgi:7-cyano-7-deazaguanine synthase